MCGIGAVIDITSKNGLASLKRRITLELIRELSVRGSDAAGIAAYLGRRVYIRKMPGSPLSFAERLEKVKGWERARVILIHDRAYTHCSPSNNYCNHPLCTKVDDKIVSLVHNGVLMVEPPNPRAPVDSYALLEPVKKHGGLSIDAAFDMLKVPGSKAVIATDGELVVFFRDGNPLVRTWIDNKLLVLASTKEIMKRALRNAGVKKHSKIESIEAQTIYHINV